MRWRGPPLLQAPWSLPGGSLELRTQREGRDVRAVFLGQLHNHRFPMCCGHSMGKGMGEGVGVWERVGGRGRSFYMIFVYWLERIFEISNHILKNAFSEYKVSQIMFKQLINCL